MTKGGNENVGGNPSNSGSPIGSDGSGTPTKARKNRKKTRGTRRDPGKPAVPSPIPCALPSVGDMLNFLDALDATCDRLAVTKRKIDKLLK